MTQVRVDLLPLSTTFRPNREPPVTPGASRVNSPVTWQLAERSSGATITASACPADDHLMPTLSKGRA
jgi:hypothetical protein